MSDIKRSWSSTFGARPGRNSHDHLHRTIWRRWIFQVRRVNVSCRFLFLSWLRMMTELSRFGNILRFSGRIRKFLAWVGCWDFVFSRRRKRRYLEKSSNPRRQPTYTCMNVNRCGRSVEVSQLPPYTRDVVEIVCYSGLKPYSRVHFISVCGEDHTMAESSVKRFGVRSRSWRMKYHQVDETIMKIDSIVLMSTYRYIISVQTNPWTRGKHCTKSCQGEEFDWERRNFMEKILYLLCLQFSALPGDEMSPDENEECGTPTQESRTPGEPNLEILNQDGLPPMMTEPDPTLHSHTIHTQNNENEMNDSENQTATSNATLLESNDLEWDTCLLDIDSPVMVNEGTSMNKIFTGNIFSVCLK